jgi:acyl-CoA dehydrogenase
MDSNNRINTLLHYVDEIGETYIKPNAEDVDIKARFPEEAFEALKEKKLLSVYIPIELGGQGLSVEQVSQLCERLAHYCASTALIYAMHQSQIACFVHHAFGSPLLIKVLQKIATEQSLLASSTSEVGVGGNLRSSICALNIDDNEFTIEKNASVLSYGENADAILITCRKGIDAPENDQVLVFGYQKDCTLRKTSNWDTLGFRGTCSDGFKILARGPTGHIFPTPFANILSETMQPIAHIYWSSVWLGMANYAVDKAHESVINSVKNRINSAEIQSFRFSELNAKRSNMRSSLALLINEYEEIRLNSDITPTAKMEFATKVNDLKINSSKHLIDIACDAMMLVGISSYSVKSKDSLCQLLRDAFGAPLMVSNDRLLNHNSILHLAKT